MKKITIISIATVAIILGATIYLLNFSNKNITTKNVENIDAKNATYIIDGKSVTLKNGLSEIETAPGSASKITTRYFGNVVKKDLNGDGREDTAFLLTQNTGGSGTFYYVVALLNTESGFIGSHGLLLGDRIAPQTTVSGKGNEIIVNYADRQPGESFAIQPSMGKSLWLLLDSKIMQFGEVVQNFEGEADTTKMTLNMKTWNWIKTVYNTSEEKPRLENKFTLSFKDNGTFSVATDCNGIGGEYTVMGNNIGFSKMMSTLMYCENSQEGDFSKMLENIKSYHFTSKGELIFDLKYDSGSMIFR